MQTITPEETLIGAIYGIYLLSCLRWISEEQVALVRTIEDAWVAKVITATSYTLLRRMPLFRNPFSTKAGFAVFRQRSLDSMGIKLLPLSGSLAAATRALAHRTRVLSWTTFISGAYLLVVCPLSIYAGLLSFLWKPLLSAAIVLHLGVVSEFFLCTRRWRKSDSMTFIPAFLSLLLNPIGAIRSADVVSQWQLSDRMNSFVRNNDRAV